MEDPEIGGFVDLPRHASRVVDGSRDDRGVRRGLRAGARHHCRPARVACRGRHRGPTAFAGSDEPPGSFSGSSPAADVAWRRVAVGVGLGGRAGAICQRAGESAAALARAVSGFRRAPSRERPGYPISPAAGVHSGGLRPPCCGDTHRTRCWESAAEYCRFRPAISSHSRRDCGRRLIRRATSTIRQYAQCCFRWAGRRFSRASAA